MKTGKYFSQKIRHQQDLYVSSPKAEELESCDNNDDIFGRVDDRNP